MRETVDLGMCDIHAPHVFAQSTGRHLQKIIRRNLCAVNRVMVFYVRINRATAMRNMVGFSPMPQPESACGQMSSMGCGNKKLAHWRAVQLMSCTQSKNCCFKRYMTRQACKKCGCQRQGLALFFETAWPQAQVKLLLYHRILRGWHENGIPLSARRVRAQKRRTPRCTHSTEHHIQIRIHGGRRETF